MKDSSNVKTKFLKLFGLGTVNFFILFSLIIEDPKELLFIWVTLINIYCTRIKTCIELYYYQSHFRGLSRLPCGPPIDYTLKTSRL